MSARRLCLTVAMLCLGAAAILPATAAAAAPGWTLALTPLPANLAPGGTGEYMVMATNVGGAVTTGAETTLSLVLPEDLTVENIQIANSDRSSQAAPSCALAASTITCKTSEPIHPGHLLILQVKVGVPALEPAGTLEAKATVAGGGAPVGARAATPTPVQAEPIPFDFLPGFVAPATSAEGTPEALAGAHPFQQIVSFGFPTKDPGDGMTNDGHPRDFFAELPRGMAGDPAATPVLCAEVELVSAAGCPDESQVGIADVTTLVGSKSNNTIFASPLYNMVPPPGAPAELATNVASVGIFVHTMARVRSESDYGIEAATRDVIAFGQQPIFNLQAQVWGDPSSKALDRARGACGEVGGECPVDEQKIAFLTMPGECSGEPLLYRVLADTWEEPAPAFPEHETAYEAADGEGDTEAALLQGCGELEYEPEIQLRPTTNAGDSPSGLDFSLHQRQEIDKEGRYTAALKDLSLHLPAGLAVNPSQAAGLGACSEAQIGLDGEFEGAPSFSDAPQSCPDDAKIGTVTALSPLLVQRNEAHEVALDPETEEPLLEPLHGSLYIATPFANPFNKLVAIYLVIEDRKTGIIAKLAGEGQLDPTSGQISVHFKQNPQLPLEDAQAHIFGGARGALTTPPTCGSYTASSQLTPWSAPEGKDAFPEGSFQISAGAAGPCPAGEAGMPNAPAFSAGTLSPQAGAFSPLLLKLSRADGSQRWQRLETSIPEGLAAKLAGVAQCPEAGIAQARSREAPNQGVLEQADPSCPAASAIGSFTGAAGSGPTPFRTSGKIYLAGPYKGAPLSAVAITPAVAGPFDLGAVVVRNALYLDPETARVRILSDPLPTILDGVPIDLRSVSIATDRSNFTLNPTSCDPKAFAGTLTSTLGIGAPLSQRFQVGGCKSLPYKPKFSARLSGPIHRGGHPRLRAVISAKPGEANTAALSFTLPRSEFIDQGHFRTICTRVQFAAHACPAGSVYGFVKAKSPLVDYTLEGPLYLRSSSHKLPDAVAALSGPPSQPVEIDAVARIDSVKGRLRARTETVPDAPIEKVVISMQGGRKGLFQNSTNICKGTHRISVSFDGQNGKAQDVEPQLKAQCPKKKGKRPGGGKKKGH